VVSLKSRGKKVSLSKGMKKRDTKKKNRPREKKRRRESRHTHRGRFEKGGGGGGGGRLLPTGRAISQGRGKNPLMGCDAPVSKKAWSRASVGWV